MSINLLCSVRNCHLRLEPCGKTFVCPSSHSFDLAKSGYLNLLQPQDRRSLSPGDSQEIVAARHRLMKSRLDQPFVEDIENFIKKNPTITKILDVGCGEGSYLGNLLVLENIIACGLDISLPAIKQAARNYPIAKWIIANGDRLLPFPDNEFDLVMSITARKNPTEFHRVLTNQGFLLVVVPAANDLIELREKVLGEGLFIDRNQQTIRTFTDQFILLESYIIESKIYLDKTMLRDLLTTTYRGARNSEKSRFSETEAMEITFSREFFYFQAK